MVMPSERAALWVSGCPADAYNTICPEIGQGICSAWTGKSARGIRGGARLKWSKRLP